MEIVIILSIESDVLQDYSYIKTHTAIIKLSIMDDY
jgi:hypothetical protein